MNNPNKFALNTTSLQQSDSEPSRTRCSLTDTGTFHIPSIPAPSPRLSLNQQGSLPVPMNVLRRSSASSDDDSLVAFSNEEAAWGKYSSVKVGLYGDPLVGLFMRPPEETHQMVLRPQPEILRGYYIREVIVRLAVKDFIEVVFRFQYFVTPLYLNYWSTFVMSSTRLHVFFLCRRIRAVRLLCSEPVTTRSTSISSDKAF